MDRRGFVGAVVAFFAVPALLKKKPVPLKVDGITYLRSVKLPPSELVIMGNRSLIERMSGFQEEYNRQLAEAMDHLRWSVHRQMYGEGKDVFGVLDEQL